MNQSSETTQRSDPFADVRAELLWKFADQLSLLAVFLRVEESPHRKKVLLSQMREMRREITSFAQDAHESDSQTDLTTSETMHDIEVELDHAIGVLSLWFQKDPSDDQDLPKELEVIALRFDSLGEDLTHMLSTDNSQPEDTSVCDTPSDKIPR
ncbi:MAG: hypothetical protein ACYTGL_07775 [Planctomycetota bacterium]|jgi:hypothetical protein